MRIDAARDPAAPARPEGTQPLAGLQLLADVLPVAVAVLDREFRYLAVSQRYARAHRAAPRDLLGRCLLDVLPGLAARWRDALRSALDGTPQGGDEDEIVRDDGTTGWLRWQMSPWTDAGGAIGGVVFSGEDVSAQVEARQALAAASQRLAAVLDNTQAAIFMMDERQHCSYMNAAAERLTGYTLAETKGRALHDVLHHTRPDGTPYPLQACPIDRAFPTAMQEQGEEVFVHRDGTFYPVAFTASPMRDAAGRTIGTVIEVRDLRAARAADATRHALQRLIDNSEDYIGLADLEGRITYLNAAARRAVGLPPGARLEECDFGTFVAPRSRAKYEQEFLPALRAHGYARAELGLCAPVGGPERTTVRSTFLLRNAADGAPLGYGTVSRDVTEEREAENRLRDADRRKDEFLATLAHELRNPLAPIRNAIQLLQGTRADAATRDWAARVLDRQVRTMASLLDELLDVSRITRGKLVLHRQTVTLATVVDAALEVARPMIESRRHALEVLLPDAPVQLDADPLRLSQVVSNLLTNAAKYTDPGGRIVLAARLVAGGTLRLSVTDTGIGLAPDSLEQVFRMFSQVKSALDRSEGGLGIGLSLVKGLVELHGGAVAAHSAGLGRGSEFVVTLPLPAASAVATESPAAAVGPAPCTRRRVVVADDNVDAARTLALLLELDGNEVHVAHDGLAAVQLLERERPDVAFVDIGMPRLTGYEVAERVRAAPWGSALRLVALTGWGQAEDRSRALAAGFDRHLTKPVDPDQLRVLLVEGGPGAVAPRADDLGRA